MKKKMQTVQRKKYKKEEHDFEITGIIMLLFGIFITLSLSGFGMGIVGDFANDGFRVLFGVSAFLIAILFIIIGAKYLLTGRGMMLNRQWLLIVIAALILLSFYHHYFVPSGNELSIPYIMAYGGVISGAIVWGVRLLLGQIGTTVLLIGLFVIDVLLLTHWSVSNGARKISNKTEKKVEVVKAKIQKTRDEYYTARENARNMGEAYHLKDFIFKKNTDVLTDHTEPCKGLECNTDINPVKELPKKSPFVEENEKEPDFAIPVINEVEISSEDTPINNEADDVLNIDVGHEIEEVEDNAADENIHADILKVSGYTFPPLSLLHPGDTGGSIDNDAEEKAERLESTLKSFGVNAKVKDVSVGPTVTRYELEPAPGVRVSKIESLADDIALQLAATSIRIEAPIPGKSAVGIEIPNLRTESVPLRDVLSGDIFQHKKGKIVVALGKDIAGNAVVADLAKMPHLLIAGQTGSGKSVCINTIITSILYHSLPEEVKLILIDPKVVELSVYNGIPHLRMEVVTNPKKAAGALNWAVQEMEDRYRSFSQSNVRDINGYNKQNTEAKMPFIVIVIDELADLMMVAKDSVEGAICRLAQKARAAGIHLVVATQRPSVDVITGLIKANIPSRISFAVSSQVDSRTILDKAGAEKLLGKGDMLFDPSGSPNPIRIQGAFISDEEVEAVVNYVKEESAKQEVNLTDYEPVDLSLLEPAANTVNDDQKDELLEEAAEWMIDTKRASVSALQRRFRIGYTRAGRLMDTMEAMGIVGKADGAKPREILISKVQLNELLASSSKE